jgi:Thioredoxin
VNESPPPPAPGPASVAVLVGLGAAAALWSLLLWGDLVTSRALGASVCTFGAGRDCGVLWDAPFATGVHAWTGIPVAGWGLVWGLAALALPLELLRRIAEQRPQPALLTAVRLVAAGGALGVFVLASVALSARAFCAGCFASYVIVLGYAGIALFDWRPHGVPELGRGAGLAAGAVLAAYLLLLYPGTRTSRGGADPAVAAAAGSGELDAFIGSLGSAVRQQLSDSLEIYRRSPQLSAAPLRSTGPVLEIVDFTDVLCPACAELHSTLEQLRKIAAPGAISIESLQFPLDASCNALVERGGEPVRCDAALARICLTGRPGAREYDGALFAEQDSLDSARVRALAEGHIPAVDLEACLADPATRRTLEEQIDLARRFEIEGTPLVVVNGRRGTSVGAFLYALLLSGGDPDHPAFSALPAPRPGAHIH